MIRNVLGTSICALVMTACTSLSTGSQSAAPVEKAEANTAFRISEISCWDLATLGAEDAGYTYTLLYAYVAGTKMQTGQIPDVISRTTRAAIETCESEPDTLAVDAFEQHWEVGR